MLNLFLKDTNIKSDKEIVVDVEKEFSKLKIKGTALEQLIIEKIEKGKYNNETSYIDRFGYKLHYNDMSTGCKAALCVANMPNKVIDLAECGYNARDLIIVLCTDGNIIIEDNGLTISTQYGNNIDVKLDNYRFTSITRLNKYICDERPFIPDMSIGGIEECM